MATKNRPQPSTPVPPTTPTSDTAPVVLPVTTELPGVTVETLIEQKRALAAQIKALRTQAPAHEGLAGEISRQEHTPNVRLVRRVQQYTLARVRRGQPADEARAAVLALCAQWIDEALTSPAPTGEGEHDDV